MSNIQKAKKSPDALVCWAGMGLSGIMIIRGEVLKLGDKALLKNWQD